MHEIKLVQKPIIKHELVKIGTEVTKRLEALNLDKQVATIETVKALKKLRAELNGEHRVYKSQDSIVKKAVNNPYDEFHDIFKIQISDKYDKADDLLKTQIGIVEDKVKEETKNKIKTYFAELCQASNIDFLEFENVGIVINLSTSEKKYKETCNAYVSRISDELLLIESMEFEAEILAEYKQTLNAAKSIKEVKDRKEREKEEIERKKQKEYIKRSDILQEIGMIPNKETKTYNYSDEIYCVWENVKDLDPAEFIAKKIEFEELIKQEEASLATLKEEKESREKVEPTTGKCKENKPSIEIPKQTKLPKPLAPPKIETKQKKVRAAFEVFGTFTEIIKLSEWMKENNYEYKNLK